MLRIELESVVKQQMHYQTEAPSCGSCKCFEKQTDFEGTKCVANIAVQFSTSKDSWCAFYKAAKSEGNVA